MPDYPIYHLIEKTNNDRLDLYYSKLHHRNRFLSPQPEGKLVGYFQNTMLHH